MNDLNRRLRDADPVPREPGLSPETLAALRRAVTVEAHAHATSGHQTSWGRQLALASALSVLTVAGIVAAHRVSSGRVAHDLALSVPSTTSAASEQRTQVQFSTPGGTRIVWTLDPGFRLRETMK